MEAPFAHVLHQETIERLADGRALQRGKAYADRGHVKELDKSAARLRGLVQGTVLYDVSIWVKGEGLGYSCSCPAGAEGDFCKHCVAVALVWLERGT